MHIDRLSALMILPAVLALGACGDDSTDPDGFDPSDLVGTFVLDPTIEATCDLGEFGDVTITIDTVEVTDATDDSVYVRLPVTASTALGDFSDDATFSMSIDSEEQTFGGSHALDIDLPAGITTVHADGSLALDGSFDDTDSFDAHVNSDLTLTVGSGTPAQCSDIDLEVTGTRDD